MNRDYASRERATGPSAEAIRDAVRDEDPANWRAGALRAPSTTFIEERIRVRERRSRPSIGASFLGWAVAAFFTIVFSALALGLVGGSALTEGAADLERLATGSLLTYLLAAFLAYLIGGYAAGRMAYTNGTWHGIAVVGWAVLFAVIAVIVSLYRADVADLNARIGFDFTDLTTAGILAIGASLLAMLAGGALGGRLGERSHEVRELAARRREPIDRRGRPL